MTQPINFYSNGNFNIKYVKLTACEGLLLPFCPDN